MTWLIRTLSDDRFRHTADGDLASLRQNLNLQLQRNLAVIVHRRRHIDIHAHIEILELRLHADAGLYRSKHPRYKNP